LSEVVAAPKRVPTITSTMASFCKASSFNVAPLEKFHFSFGGEPWPSIASPKSASTV
jgi:hypothetical protein